jgi:hypothetical protein
MAQSGHPSLHRTCPLSGVKRTFAPSDIQQMLHSITSCALGLLLSWRDEGFPFFNDINRIQFDGLVSRAFIVNGAVGKC